MELDQVWVLLRLDVLLIIPVNAVIFLRNLFPGEWRYRSFSGRCWRYVITWLWRGEALPGGDDTVSCNLSAGGTLFIA